jgi:zinc/manganese transport system ATP-binding protein
MPDIIVKNLTAGYERHPAIHHIDTVFKDGSLTAIIGPNGGGKSTLLKALVGLIKPMSGSINFSTSARHRMAYLPQQSAIDRSFPITVEDVVLMGHWRKIGFFKSITAGHRQQALAALEQVGMAAFAHRPIATLSTGQFQRVLFARLMIEDVDFYLLDEPFSAIDSRTIKDLMRIIRLWGREGKTVLCVLHDMQQVREHFPQALLLAREIIIHDQTDRALTESNLRKASDIASTWHDHAEECQVTLPEVA